MQKNDSETETGFHCKKIKKYTKCIKNMKKIMRNSKKNERKYRQIKQNGQFIYGKSFENVLEK